MAIINNTVLRLPRVKNATGLSRSTIYSYVKKGAFPAPVRLGARAVGWLESDVEAWISARVPTAKPTMARA